MAAPELTAPSADDAAMAARVLVRLLGGRRAESLWGAPQSAAGYVGRCTVGVRELVAHFRGEATFAVAAWTGDQGRAVAWEIDRRGPARARAIFRALERRGLTDAAIATGGSDAERAKVVLLFARSHDNASLRAFGEDVLAEARHDADWGDVLDVGWGELRPIGGEGGLLRIGGRNAKRGGALEPLYDPLTGELRPLLRIAPTRVDLPRVRAAIPVSRRQAWVDVLLRDGLTYGPDGTKGVRRTLMRLAHEAIRLHGVARAERELEAWATTLRERSPSLDEPSPTNADLRNPIARLWRSAFVAAVRERERRAVDITSAGGRSRDVMSTQGKRDCFTETLDVLRTYVDRRGLNPVAFSLSYRELARALGVVPQAAHDRIKRLVELGQVVVHFRGAPGSPRRIKTVYGLPALCGGRAACVAGGRAHHLTLTMQAKVDAWHAERARELAKRVLPLRDRVDELLPPASTRAIAPAAAETPANVDRDRATRSAPASTRAIAPAAAETPANVDRVRATRSAPERRDVAGVDELAERRAALAAEVARVQARDRAAREAVRPPRYPRVDPTDAERTRAEIRAWLEAHARAGSVSSVVRNAEDVVVSLAADAERA